MTTDSKPIDDGGPAWPERVITIERDSEGGIITSKVEERPGMYLRDWFAGQVEVPDDLGWVAAALMGSKPPSWSNEGDYDKSLECAKWWATARARFRMMEADAMIRARKAAAQ